MDDVKDNESAYIEDVVLDRKEGAKFLKISVRQLDRERKNKKSGLPYTKIGRRIVFSKYLLAQWVRNRSIFQVRKNTFAEAA